MYIFLVLLYLLGCGLTGFMGRKTTIGFIGHFFLAVFITPILDFAILLVTMPKREIREKLENLD